MAKTRQQLSHRSMIIVGVLAVGAIASVAVTSSTSWWPWVSQADEVPDFSGNIPEEVLKKLETEGGNIDEGPRGELEYTAPDGTKSVIYGGDTLFADDIPPELLRRVVDEGGTLDLKDDGTYTYTTPEGATERGTATASASNTACTGPAGAFIDPCATLGENIQRIYKESIGLMLLLAFLVLVYVGYRYVTSLGNPEATKDAKDWAVAAVSGIALLLLIPLIMEALGVTSNSNVTTTQQSTSSTQSPSVAPNLTKPTSGVNKTPTTQPVPTPNPTTDPDDADGSNR